MSTLESSISAAYTPPAAAVKKDGVITEFEEINSAAGIKDVWLVHFGEKVGPMISRYSTNKSKLPQFMMLDTVLSGETGFISAGVYDGRLLVSYSFQIPDTALRAGKREYALILKKDSLVANFLELGRSLRPVTIEYADVLSRDLEKTREY